MRFFFQLKPLYEENNSLSIYKTIKKDISLINLKKLLSREEYPKFLERMKAFSKEDLYILKWFSVLSELYPECYNCNLNIELISKAAICDNNYKILEWIINQGKVLDIEDLYEAWENGNKKMVEWIKEKNPLLVGKDESFRDIKKVKDDKYINTLRELSKELKSF